MAKHFVAVSTNAEKVGAFGIDTENMFGFWDWVGGRYSYDSAIGLSLMVAIGPERFAEMLDGIAYHRRALPTVPYEENLPALLGLISVWYIDFFGARPRPSCRTRSTWCGSRPTCSSSAWSPTASPSSSTATPVDTQTGEIFWGEPGTNGQHAFYQLLHQGTQLVPADFIGFVEPNHDLDDMHDLFMANYFAQTAALAFGRTAEEIEAEGTPPEVVPHKVCREIVRPTPSWRRS